jgi:hypothetical protein
MELLSSPQARPLRNSGSIPPIGTVPRRTGEKGLTIAAGSTTSTIHRLHHGPTSRRTAPCCGLTHTSITHRRARLMGPSSSSSSPPAAPAAPPSSSSSSPLSSPSTARANVAPYDPNNLLLRDLCRRPRSPGTARKRPRRGDASAEKRVPDSVPCWKAKKDGIAVVVRLCLAAPSLSPVLCRPPPPRVCPLRLLVGAFFSGYTTSRVQAEIFTITNVMMPFLVYLLDASMCGTQSLSKTN